MSRGLRQINSPKFFIAYLLLKTGISIFKHNKEFNLNGEKTEEMGRLFVLGPSIMGRLTISAAL